jgi:ribosome biogenesis protein Nip4
MKLINEFVSRFGVKISFKKNLVRRKGRYFLLDDKLKNLARGDFFYAGIYLGKVKGGKFFPSFNLLRLIAEKEANNVVVDDKTAWLFICGRDIFKHGIVRMFGSKKKGDYTLILNKHGECLGFGKILCDIDKADSDEVVVQNIVDIGDFLRREKQRVN